MPSTTIDLSALFAQQLAQRTVDLPVLPATAAEILDLCQRDSTDARRLSAVIHRDQGIASQVLRFANSAANGGHTPCASLQQAVGRLGLAQISEIALAVSMRGQLIGGGRCAALLQRLWRHSVLAGFYTKEIARLRRRNVEIAFLCGLLHDIGKAVLLPIAAKANAGPAELRADGELLAALEQHHTAAGALLAELWRLPAPIQEAVVHHHDHTGAQRHADMAMMVCFADLLAHEIAADAEGPPTERTRLAAHPVLEALNLYPDQLQALLARREEALSVAEGMA